MEIIQIIATIGVIGTIVGVVINYKSLRKNKRLKAKLTECKQFCSSKSNSSCNIHLKR